VLRKWGQKVKGQGHAIIECAAEVGLQVDMTAWFLVLPVTEYVYQTFWPFDVADVLIQTMFSVYIYFN